LKAIKFPVYYKQKSIVTTPTSVEPEAMQTLYPINREIEAARRLRKKVVIPAWDITMQFNQSYYPKLKPNTYDHDPFAKPLRCGAIGVKVGMTACWDKWGTRHPLTVVQLDRNQITQVRTREYDGVDALQVGAGEANIKTISKPLIGHFLKNDLPAKKHLCEFPITPENILPVGFMISVRHFTPGQLLDVSGISNGKGI
jgi:large subunit ribosomal protein L3